MVAFNFPNTPQSGQKHEENGVKYVWTGKVWNIVDPMDEIDHHLRNKVNRSGDTMSGPLLLRAQAGEGDPGQNPGYGDPHEATSKAYQQHHFLQDAPPNGAYARTGTSTQTAEDGQWVLTTSFVDAPSKTDMTYGRWESQWRPVPEEAESDGKLYGRQDTNWVETVSKEYVDDIKAALEHEDRNKVDKSGDSMLGPLYIELNAEPTDPRHAVHKNYVDSYFPSDAPTTGVYGRTGGEPQTIGGKPYAPDGEWVQIDPYIDAPIDGVTYGRKDGYWWHVTEEAPRDSTIYGRQDGVWVETLPDAPDDGSIYGRQYGGLGTPADPKGMHWYKTITETDLTLMGNNKVDKSGDSMTGGLYLPSSQIDPNDPGGPTLVYPTDMLHAVPKRYVDQLIGANNLYRGIWYVEANDPDLNAASSTAINGSMWIAKTSDPNVPMIPLVTIPGLENTPINSGDSIIWNDATSKYDVIQGSSLSIDQADDMYVNVIGDTMRGHLYLQDAEPLEELHAVHKRYVDDIKSALEHEDRNKVDKSGDSMLGPLVIEVNAEPTDPRHAVHKKYVDSYFPMDAPPDDEVYARKGGEPQTIGGLPYAPDGEWVKIDPFIDAPDDGKLYGRQWSGLGSPADPKDMYWQEAASPIDLELLGNNKVSKSGDSIFGPLYIELNAEPTQARHAVHKAYVDNLMKNMVPVSTELEPPVDVADGALWWDEDTAGLYLYYDDGNSKQWVQVNGAIGGGSAALLDSAPVDDIVYGLKNKNWTPTHYASYGDIKNGFQTTDHAGWIKLDGRAVATMSPKQQANAVALGFPTNLPNAAGSVQIMNAGALGSISGTMSRQVTVAVANLPVHNMTAASAGAHTHPVPWSGTTNSQLGFSDEVGQGPRTGKIAAGGTGQYYMKADATNVRNYSHTHTVSGNATASSGGAHTHTVALGGGGTPLSIDMTPQAMSVNTFVYLGY